MNCLLFRSRTSVVLHAYRFRRRCASLARQLVCRRADAVSMGSDISGSGTSEDPVSSANGRFVAFHSFAFNPVPNDTNAGGDVFVRTCKQVRPSPVSINLADSTGQR